MERKILCVCIVLSAFFSMALGFHLLIREPVCGHVHRDEIDWTRDVVPDAETAVLLVRTKLGKRLINDYPYEYRVFFNEPSYEWIVFVRIREEDIGILLDGEHVVWLRRDYGIVSNYHR